MDFCLNVLQRLGFKGASTLRGSFPLEFIDRQRKIVMKTREERRRRREAASAFVLAGGLYRRLEARGRAGPGRAVLHPQLQTLAFVLLRSISATAGFFLGC